MKGIVISVRGFGLAALVAAAPAAAQVTLNASSWVSPGHPLTATMLVPLCADIEKATAARVKCNILPKAPVGAVQTFDGVKDGLMDLSFITHGYTPGRFALTDAPEFPFMGDTAEVTAVAYQRIYERMLAGANEHRDVVLLSVLSVLLIGATLWSFKRHRDRFGNVDGNSAKPQLPRLLAEIEAADGKTGGKIESCRQKIGTAQT